MAGGAADIEQLGDDEIVARLCFKADFPVTHDQIYPSDVDPETGLYRLEEIQWKDFSKPDRGGFSVQRTTKFSRADAQKALDDRIARRTAAGKIVEGYALQGVVLAPVVGIHGISGEQGAAFSVQARPLEGNEAHAAVVATKACTSGEFLKHRKVLQQLFGQVQDISVLPERVGE